MLLEWVKVVGPLLFSWPIALVIAVIFLRPQARKLVEAFVSRSGGKAELGPLKIELGSLVEDGREAVSNLNRITEVMAQSRVLELETTLAKLGMMFTDEQRQGMQKHTAELSALIKR